jgi:hypothetical protein
MVVLVGLVSCALAMLAVYGANSGHFYVMGYYVALVFPAGAFGMGLVACSGFGLGAWLFGRRFDKTLGTLVVACLVLTYFGAEYVEWRARYPHGVVDAHGQLLGFWGYFDALTRMASFNNGNNLGAFGYGLRAVELAGFALGGLIGTDLLLGRRPFCAPCSRYRKTAWLGLMPVGEDEAVQRMADASGDGRKLRSEIAASAPTARTNELAHEHERWSVLLVHCPACRAGELGVDVLAGVPSQRTGLRHKTFRLDSHVVTDLLRAQS